MLIQKGEKHRGGSCFHCPVLLTPKRKSIKQECFVLKERDIKVSCSFMFSLWFNQWFLTFVTRMLLNCNSQKPQSRQLVVKASGSYSPKLLSNPRLRTSGFNLSPPPLPNHQGHFSSNGIMKAATNSQSECPEQDFWCCKRDRISWNPAGVFFFCFTYSLWCASSWHPPSWAS